MLIQRIHVEGFGTLRDCRLDDLHSGLTVIYGANGSGKSTILEFLRGVFCGFGPARDLKLLPPLRGGPAGGSVQLKIGDAAFQLIRHSRSGDSDSLAISVKQGLADQISAVRERIGQLPESLLRTLFMVGGFEAHAFPPLLKFAKDANIPISHRRQSAEWLTPVIRNYESRVHQLRSENSSSGAISDLYKERDLLAQKLSLAQARQLALIQTWRESIAKLKAELERLQQRSGWLNSEIGVTQSDLIEVQTRLWSTQKRTVSETTVIEEAVDATDESWRVQFEDIDSQILTLQKALRVLSQSRHDVELHQTLFAGADVVEPQSIFEKQRAAIARLESGNSKLNEIATFIADCVQNPSQMDASELANRLSEHSEDFKQQIWVLCQELSRQQSLFSFQKMQAEKQRIDGCESELVEQIRFLRRRRDSLLKLQNVNVRQQQSVRSVHDHLYCDCNEHDLDAEDASNEDNQARLVAKTIETSREVIVSDARPGDASAEQLLKERLSDLRHQKSTILRQIHDVELELAQQSRGVPSISRDQSVNTIRNEQQLNDSRIAQLQRSWESLNWATDILRETQSHFTIEVVPVVIEEASRLLRQMTAGRYVGMRFRESQQELSIQTDDGRELFPRSLSRGTHEQAALCLRIALAQEMNRQGFSIPLVLDDVLIDSDEERSVRAVDALIEVSEKMQIVYLTCQEHLVKRFLQRKVMIVDLPGSVSPRGVIPELLEPQETPSPIQTGPTSGQRSSESAQSSASSTVSLPPSKTLQTFTPRASVAPMIAAQPVTVQHSTSPLADGQNLIVQQPAVPSPSAKTDLEANSEYLPEYLFEPTSLLVDFGFLDPVVCQRLAQLGVRSVGDLIEFDPSSLDIPLETLQLSLRELKAWQAEARLLSLLDGLTVFEARYLVLLGFLSPEDLIGLDEQEFYLLVQEANRSDSLVRESLSHTGQNADWPSRKTVARWISSAKRARDWKQLRHDRKTSVSVDQTHPPEIAAVAAAPEFSFQNVSKNESVTDEESMGEETVDLDEKTWRFYLKTDSPIVDAPSIGPRTAERLNAIGIYLVSDLLEMDSKEIATTLGRREINNDTVSAWKNQSVLMCHVPQLRGHDAQVLVACGVTDQHQLSRQNPNELFKKVRPFVRSKEGQRLLRSSKVPDLQEVTDWIHFAQNSPLLSVGN